MQEKHGFDYDLLRILAELEFDLDLDYKLKVSRIMHDYDFYRDWIYCINKQKKWGELCAVLIYSKIY